MSERESSEGRDMAVHDAWRLRKLFLDLFLAEGDSTKVPGGSEDLLVHEEGIALNEGNVLNELLAGNPNASIAQIREMVARAYEIGKVQTASKGPRRQRQGVRQALDNQHSEALGLLGEVLVLAGKREVLDGTVEGIQFQEGQVYQVKIQKFGAEEGKEVIALCAGFVDGQPYFQIQGRELGLGFKLGEKCKAVNPGRLERRKGVFKGVTLEGRVVLEWGEGNLIAAIPERAPNPLEPFVGAPH